MPGISRAADAVSHRREQVARLRLRGLSQREIANALAQMTPPIVNAKGQPFNQAQISRDLDHVRALWEASATEAIDKRRARQMAELDEVRRKAWANNDMPSLLKAIKLEADLFGTLAPVKVDVRTWQDEVIGLLREKRIAPAEVVREYGESLAAELFTQAGVTVIEHDAPRIADAGSV